MSNDIDWAAPDPEFVRRHSISLTDRTPPGNSLAADILGKNVLGKMSLMSSIKDLQDVLSDFNSCNSTLYSSSSESESPDLKNKTVSTNRNKRKKKAKTDLVRGDFLKKKNTQASPQ